LSEVNWYNPDEKPVVYYRPSEGTHIRVGEPARVFAIDHPLMSDEWFTTTTVRQMWMRNTVTENVSFCTKNTVYHPLELQK